MGLRETTIGLRGAVIRGHTAFMRRRGPGDLCGHTLGAWMIAHRFGPLLGIHSRPARLKRKLYG